VLIAHPEQFAVDLPRAESQLHLSGILIRLERQRVLYVALGLEGGRDGWRHASGTGPAGIALTSRLGEAAHASAMLPAAECRLLIVADLLGLRATSDAVPRQTRMREVVQLAVVEKVLNAAVEALAYRHVLPLVVRRVELFDVQAADLQRRVHVQVLVERRHCARSLTTRVVELGRTAILQLGNLRGFAVVDDELDGLSNESSLGLGFLICLFGKLNRVVSLIDIKALCAIFLNQWP